MAKAMPAEPIPVSALEHFVYCERQWALIHLEQVFEDNDDTIRGHHAHERVDDAGAALRSGVIIERRLPIWSETLGLYGFCDVVERHGNEVIPVEYKSGKTFSRAAEVQVAAQALCLEEMLDCKVPIGVIYSVGSNVRHTIAVDQELRGVVVDAVAAIRGQSYGEMPAPAADVRCRRCSLRERCLPQLVADPRQVHRLVAETAET